MKNIKLRKKQTFRCVKGLMRLQNKRIQLKQKSFKLILLNKENVETEEEETVEKTPMKAKQKLEILC